MITVLQITNMILDEIWDMPANSTREFPTYGIRAEKSENQTFIYSDTEIHYAKVPSNLRPFIRMRVQKVREQQKQKDLR